MSHGLCARHTQLSCAKMAELIISQFRLYTSVCQRLSCWLN